MFKSRRSNYLNQVEAMSLSVFYSGFAPHLSADAFYPFQVNRNFWYLTNINQEDAILLMAKSNNLSDSYLFIKKIDPVEALWVGESLSFEKASELSGIPLENVRDILSFDTFISSLLTQSRRALFGTIEKVYFDIERLNFASEALLGERKATQFKNKYPHIEIVNSHPVLAYLRSSKDSLELEKIKGAIEISKKANLHLLDSLKKVKNEYDLATEFNYVLNKHQTVPSFGSIIAGGKNATILHYEHHNQDLNQGDLVLLDLGVRYEQYASDITRTYPINGTFTARQKAVYQAVLNVNKAIISWVKAGVTQFEYNEKGKELLAKEAKAIGLIQADNELIKYYYHGLGHALGLDVHDVGNPQLPFRVGQVITIEPGLYISEEGIGVRIEDNLMLTEDGCINLSAGILKEVSDIEMYMNKK